jgi:hypothetical protein
MSEADEVLLRTSEQLRLQVSDLMQLVERLRAERQALRAEIVDCSDTAMLQEIGIYRYQHPLDSAAAYKDALKAIEQAQDDLVKSQGAVSTTKKWAINGSEKEGTRMVADFGKLVLRAYNNEVDNVLRSMKPYALDAALARLNKLRSAIAKLGASMKLAVTDEFHALRVKEMQLTADYLVKIDEEREQQREDRARLKEEEAAQRELEREKARLEQKLEKEKAHYEAAIEAMRLNGDKSAVSAAEKNLNEIRQALDGVVERAANIRAGYVYVISNVGSFGEDIIKIGLTRRLEPLDRVRELGDASVPFRFDVHALVFSKDAVGLEAGLHHEFADRRVNLVNRRREYFFVTPSEVRDVLQRFQGSLLSFRVVPEAVEWRQSRTQRLAVTGPGVEADAGTTKTVVATALR